MSRQIKIDTSKGTIALQGILLRSDYGIHADIKLISHDSAFLLASILLACVADELNPGIVRLRISDQKLVPCYQGFL